MKIFINILENGNVRIQARVEAGKGNVGDFFQEIGPNQTFMDISYSDFISHGDGEMEIKEPKKEKK